MNAIEKLRKVYNYLDNHAASGEADLIGEVIEELENPWRPIETARDKEDILVLYDNGTVEKLILLGSKWHQSCCHEFVVTKRGQIGWMPLPAPPTCTFGVDMAMPGTERTVYRTNEESSAVQTESEEV